MKTASRPRGAISALPIRMLALMAAFAMPLCACGGNAKSSQTPALSPSMLGGVGIAAATTPDTSAQAAEVLAAQAPEGVDPALWEMLRNELAKQLSNKSVKLSDKLIGSIMLWSKGIQWSNLFMSSDGNDDGVINVADITPLVIHYGEINNYQADYNGDRIVDIRDITTLAMHYGISCGGFVVQCSSTGEGSGFSTWAILHYSDYFQKYLRYRKFRTAFYPWEQPLLWVKVQVLNHDGNVIGETVSQIPVGGSGPPTLRMSTPVIMADPPKITWNTAGLLADGNQDGVTDGFDLGFILEYSVMSTENSSYRQVFDYDQDGQVNVSDIHRWAASYQFSIARFSIELSTASADDGYSEIGSVNYLSSTGFDTGGFRYYKFVIPSPPAGLPYWVRVVPYGKDGGAGPPSLSVEFGGGV